MERTYKIGERVQCTYGHPDHSQDVTVGAVYEIIGRDGEGYEFFLDDVDDKNFSAARLAWDTHRFVRVA